MSLFTIYVFIAGWLAPDVTNDTLATCKYCRVVLKAHKKDLVSHAKTEKHKKATAWEKSAKECKSISEIYTPVLSENTKIAELKIAAFIAEHCSLLHHTHTHTTCSNTKYEIPITVEQNIL